MNIFNLPQLPLNEEFIEILAENNDMRIEKIISTGQTSDWYDQCENEFIILLEGNAKLEYEDGKISSLIKGDILLIKSNEKHRVYYTSNNPPCIWLCVFFN